MKQIVTNTGSNTSDLTNGSEADNRKYKIDRAITPIKTQTPDMTHPDDTQYKSVNYETPIVSDYEGTKSRQLYFEEQEQINDTNKKEPQREHIFQKRTCNIQKRYNLKNISM